MLNENGNAKCALNHSFDRAKEGYYNLLLSSVGGVHGDNREMVEARRYFLATGAYRPLAETVAALSRKYFFGGNILDIGCGEGYYTDIIEQMLAADGVPLSMSGFDISKDAVKRAARKNKRLSLAVASAYHMPVADGAIDMALNMFSPLALSETLRVLREGGVFIMAIPGEDHLFELKAATYKTPYKNEVADPALEGFSLLESKRLKYTVDLKSGEEVASLFMMTPYAYRTSPEDKKRVLSLNALSVTAEFIIFVYKKQ